MQQLVQLLSISLKTGIEILLLIILLKGGFLSICHHSKDSLNLNLIIVLITHPELEVMVEGHTDSIAIHNSVLLDNWNLSVKRSISDLRF
jgi:chemotaxis protein MotB